MKEFSFCQTQELITIINVYVYMHTISNIKNKRSMSIVLFPTVRVRHVTCSFLEAFIFPVHRWELFLVVLTINACMVILLFICTCKRSHFLSFPNKQTNETLLVCFLWSSSSMALIRQETYMYTNNDCFKNNDVWMNYSKFVNISYA